MIHPRMMPIVSFSLLVMISIANSSVAQTKQNATSETSTLRKQIEEILDDAELSRSDRIRRLSVLIEREEAALTLKDVNRWLKDLASPDFQKREAAEKNLIKVGEPAVILVEKTATGDDLEQTTRCLTILTKIAKNKDKPPSAAALKALARLSKSESPIGVQAAKRLAALSETDKDRAIAAIEATGARVYRSRSTGDVRSVRASRGTFSDREMKLLKHFPRMTTFSASGGNITDDGLEHLSQLKNLRSVSFLRSSISDAGLEQLSTFKNLTSISLGSGNYTIEGLRKLGDSPNLRSLMLHDFSPTKENIKILNSFNGLGLLSLSFSAVTDKELEEIGKLSKLSALTVSNSPGLTDTGLAHLKPLSLRSLHILNSQISDDGLEHLSKMTSLNSLMLGSNKISDKGLAHLSGLKVLTMLFLQNTQVSNEGIEKLRKDLPSLRHVYNNSQPVPSKTDR